MNRNLLIILVASSILCGCATPSIDGVSKASNSSVAAGLMGGFRPNETLHVYSSSHAGQRKGTIKATGDNYNYSPVPRDIEIVPVKTTSSADASALISTKRAEVLGGCNKDKLTDKTTCRMNILPQGSDQKGGLYQTVDSSGVLLSSCVIGHDFPGKSASIRVDGNAAFTTNEKGCIGGEDARRLERQLLDGKLLITRRVEWPYEDRRDREVIIAGSFSAAIELYKWSATADLKHLFAAR